LGEAGQAAGEQQQLRCGEAVALVSGCRVKPLGARFVSAGMLEVLVLAAYQGLLRARGAAIAWEWEG